MTRDGNRRAKDGRDQAELTEYRRRRDVDRSGEPTGSGAIGDEPQFVVQRHDASSLHFDFRLQIGDVLVSWAVPKGPSLDPREKRLATRTDDHPLAYADFEGSIPPGEYGAGTVVVWDRGPLQNRTRHDEQDISLEDALVAGHLRVELFGEKLTGQFSLTQTRIRGNDRNWLLVKVDDDDADRRRKPERTQPESVLSGRTNDDLKD
ncbi:DNA polymerase ligase N-terminal domain-containing protein [Microlunatus soli]|uniref:DNA ligase D, 3'-phosphoesterase domain-containing protein n=1 Tax=Microlunatus soli TaxID=630515 RepID=A0A1H1NA64_9ACTN|nr:DNA polymerase ligase N-terminal domain-containing protein [Microlunatus soli]SDR95808.1 DNA ligase D, 3'-phosphoesterase domain-containing protein [Microlunatus soli]